MCIPVAAAILGSAVLGAGASLINGSKARAQQDKAQQQNIAMAEKNAQRSEEQMNKANQKMPGIAQLFASNKLATSRGIGSTFLTGPSGVNMTGALGGRPSLLGGG